MAKPDAQNAITHRNVDFLMRWHSFIQSPHSIIQPDGLKKKVNHSIGGGETDRPTDRQTARQGERERETERQGDKETERQRQRPGHQQDTSLSFSLPLSLSPPLPPPSLSFETKEIFKIVLKYKFVWDDFFCSVPRTLFITEIGDPQARASQNMKKSSRFFENKLEFGVVRTEEGGGRREEAGRGR